MSFVDILTPPILQVIIRYFEPFDWTKWNMLCRESRRRSAPFLPTLIKKWTQNSWEGTGRTNVKLYDYEGKPTHTIEVSKCSYFLTTGGKQIYSGVGEDQCWCSTNGKVGIQLNQVHGTVHRFIHGTDSKIEHHAHYNMGRPIVTYNVVVSEDEDGSPKKMMVQKKWSASDEYVISRLSVDINENNNINIMPAGSARYWVNGYDGTVVDPAKCTVCQLLEPHFK